MTWYRLKIIVLHFQGEEISGSDISGSEEDDEEEGEVGEDGEKRKKRRGKYCVGLTVGVSRARCPGTLSYTVGSRVHAGVCHV